ENVPPYAILSHTWQEGQEVTYDDLITGNGTDKAGYNKILFCARQAQRDGLDYCWVDTCCIDKSSSAELSEAINSMFRWYQKAQKCYVYLLDVSNYTTDGDGKLSRKWEPAFRQSRWFTRGWTLQELIAPKTVEFFSREEELLGSKETLAQLLHKITGIPVKVLQGESLSDCSVTERFSWAAKRQTTRAEDESYCLLGIFDIQMPLLYGEGRQKAMKRLQKEIREAAVDQPVALAQEARSGSQHEDEKADKIRRWLSAPDPSTNYYKALKQLQNDTGLWFLEGNQYAEWKTSTSSSLWLHGIPGCGKTILTSTVLQDVLQHRDGDTSKALAYFFFDFNDVQKQSAELMVRSLICQLLQQCVTIPTSLRTLLFSCENGQRQPSLHALLEVLQQIMREFLQVYVILDALDGCSERAELTDILETMSAWQLQNSHTLLASRRERDLESSLVTFIHQQNFVDLQSKLVDRDIQKYVRQRLSDDKRLSKWGKDSALRQDIEAALMKGAQGMFRWAVCQLDALRECRTRASLQRSLATLPPTLDKTYDRILSAISEVDAQYAVPTLRWLTFSARPLSVEEVAKIVAISLENEARFDRDEVLEDPLDVLSICSSLVAITTDKDNGIPRRARQVVALAHYSVKEYLVSDRIGNGLAACYSMQAAACHDAIARSCLGYLLQFRGVEMLSQDNVKEFRLADYSASCWMEHAQATEEHAKGYVKEAMVLLSEENDAYLNCLRIHDPDKPWWDSDFQKRL
ncbi:HET-domain-containing protein, partial [Bimuria novae-zelandiae CBS 107.79]